MIRHHDNKAIVFDPYYTSRIVIEDAMYYLRYYINDVDFEKNVAHDVRNIFIDYLIEGRILSAEQMMRNLRIRR